MNQPEAPVSPVSYEIVTLKTGIKSLRAFENMETFHPVSGPRAEANILHVTQQRIYARSNIAKKTFVLWDVGLGAAANVLAAIESLYDSEKKVEIHSFDKSTAPLEFALAHAAELGYFAGHEAKVRRLLDHGQVELGPYLSWSFHLGDFGQMLRAGDLPAPDSIFYDPYSPQGNPEMWSLEHFELLHSKLDPELPCLLTNYTRSTAVRVTLLLAGFYVGRGCEVAEKAETTIASNKLSSLVHPLDRSWFETVRISHSAAPLRAGAMPQTPISPQDFERLKALPQFNL